MYASIRRLSSIKVARPTFSADSIPKVAIMQSRLFLFTSAALLGFLSPVSAADPFYDNSIFPNADDTVSLESTQAQAQTSKASCTLTSYATTRNY